ncbi:hypothetical protein NEOKW01_0160 [Nematocida sp. AWRm80]|nr:hypothetical protein NEOKW01_0160 [Nematocida sp. AWRm80]
MLVGASGLGKTSFISTLAREEKESLGEFSEHKIVLDGKEVFIYDHRGYGSKQDIQEKFSLIDTFIKERYKEYLIEETKIERDPFFDDRRIHLLILFISSGTRGMKEYDLTLLKLLHNKLNIITVIPKCDYFLKEELQQQKEKIRQVIQENKIDLFELEPAENIPLAIFSATKSSTVGPVYQTRELPTGVIQTHNEDHSDYQKFLQILSQERNDLQNTTHLHFYEKYRSAMLRE